ncbi:MAG: YitT family protein, partial [Bacillales bacterium]|nr:YitT family protein [Bacillales bacterium]
MKKKYILKTILNYSIIIVLGALLALDYILFIVPNSFAPAGINGIAVMIQYAFNFSIGYMSLIINIPLCVLAFFFVNKRFAIRTLLFSVSYSLFYLLFNKISGLQQFVYNAEGIDTIYPVLIAGT